MAKEPISVAGKIEGLQRVPGWHGGTLPLPPSANAPSAVRGLHKRQFGVMVANIEQILEFATPTEMRAGVDWYPSGNEHSRRMGRLAGVTNDEEAIRVGAGVIAPLSASHEWDANLINAHHLIKHGETAIKQRPDFERKARDVLAGADPEQTVINPGRPKVKVWNFYHNLEDPTSPHYVTIDRHAHDALTGVKVAGQERGLSEEGRYNYVASPYHIVADRRNMLPNVAQATAWGTYQRLKGDRARGFNFEDYLKGRKGTRWEGQPDVYDDYMAL